MIRRLSIAAGLIVVALGAGPALAQDAQKPAPAPDGPTVTARHVNAPEVPADAQPLPKAPPIVRTDDLPNAAPQDKPAVAVKRQQIFVSPMGEPFRAPFGQAYPVEAWFAQADANHDGAVTLEEFRTDALRFFKQLDENGDNVIDGFEVGDYEAKVAPEILPQVAEGLSAQDVLSQDELAKSGHRRRRPEDALGGPGGNPKGALRDAMTGAALFGFLAEPEPVRGSDENLDFKVSKAEWMSAASRRFAKLDKNHDGKLDRAELPQTLMQKMLIEEDKRRAKEAAKRKR